MANWTQPVCNTCWGIMHDDEKPFRVPISQLVPDERCAICGNATKSGIYLRMDPTTVKYPKS